MITTTSGNRQHTGVAQWRIWGEREHWTLPPLLSEYNFWTKKWRLILNQKFKKKNLERETPPTHTPPFTAPSTVSIRTSRLWRCAPFPLHKIHKYATKSPLVTMGRSKFTPKLPLPFDDNHLYLIYPSLDRPHLPPQRHPSPLSRFATIYFPDRPTDGLGEKPVLRVLTLCYE